VTTTELPCPVCCAATVVGDAFCESCGASLGPETGAAPAAAALERSHHLAPHKFADPDEPAADEQKRACAECAGTVEPDGYCGVCGAKATSDRDHWEERPTSWVGATCDRGVRHARNEDAMAAAAEETPGSFASLVTCDGVTSAPRSDEASLAAARAARDSLVAARTTQPELASPSARVVHWTTKLAEAVGAAQETAAATAAGLQPGVEPPSCTFVAAVVDGPAAVAGWVGDSRAYWLPDSGEGVQLTVDDSWATEQVAAGMPREQAEADSRCHAITRWLGADAPDLTPRCSSIAVDSAGWLLVCSDGLWNYASPPAALRALVDEAAAVDPDPLAVSRALVDFANARGGQDNITAMLARLPGPDAPPASATT
jgi:serine/threonine protein phosphatase PrpC